MCARGRSRPRLSGAEAERAAAELLKAGGHQILARNFDSPVGELDLVTMDGDTLCFVEVKARFDPRFGGAVAAVDRRKRGRLVRAAEAFLCEPERSALRRCPCRFDVVTATWSEEESDWTFTHYPDAFTVDDAGRRSWL
ncbi:MAG: YraN family protein [Acidobacteriota bacterium]|nr:YraN family protein [Acidobacteriota bacterium]MDE2922262.1 YraN family protein [Acidobacteriota bacterium]MDE3265237.1 YraN family protein [Acidobacteriota bacterium]